MTSKSKSIAIVLCTLVLGMVIGALLFGVVQRHRLETATGLVRPNSMAPSIVQAMRPMDEQQRRAMREVINGTFEEMRQMRQEHRGQMRAQMDSLEDRLKPLLTEEQQLLLSAHLDAAKKLAGRHLRRRMGKDFRPRHRSGSQGGPGQGP